MQQPSWGQLVKVSAGGPDTDGIIFDIPSASKVVVAVVDPARGPVFKTVSPSTLSERDGEGPQDAALHSLIRRTPQAGRGGARGGAGSVRGSAGHGRASGHRTTGK